MSDDNDDKVVTFPPRKRPIAAVEAGESDSVSEDVRRTFGDLSDLAQSGTIRGIAFVCVDDEGALIYQSSVSDSPAEICVGLDILRHRIIRAIDEAPNVP